MSETEESTGTGAGLTGIYQLKLKKALLKSAFTRQRNKFNDVIQGEYTELAVTEAWDRVDTAQSAAQELMTALSEEYLNIKDEDGANQVISEIELMEKEFEEASRENRRVRKEISRRDQPDRATQLGRVTESRHHYGGYGYSPIEFRDEAGDQNSDGETEGAVGTTSPGSRALGQDMWKQLKRVSIPMFSGDKKVYENGKAAFMSCIDNAPATPEYKLLQLRQYLSGEALKVIESLGHTAAAYEIAKERLDRKYGGKRRQIALRFDELHDFKPIRSGNASDVESFADLLDITIVNLKDTGLDTELDSRLLYLVLVKKMTEAMVTQYQRWLQENGREEGVEVLREWVIKEAEYCTVAHESVRGMSELTVGGTDPRTNRRQNGQRSFVTTGSNRNCKNCDEQHGVWACPDFESQTITQRWQLAKQVGLCYRCLGDNHRGRDCKRSRVCGIDSCKSTHHRLLHDVQKSPPGKTEGYRNQTGAATKGEPGSKEQKPKVDGQAQTATVMTGTENNERYVALRTIPVIVTNGRRRIKINALLDDASTSTYINSDVASELGLQGSYIQTEVSVLNGQTETFETMPVQFGLESLDRRVDMTIEAKTTENVTGDAKAIDWNEMVNKWDHLEGINFPKFGKRSKIDMLIGVDHVDLHYSLRDVCGKPGEPIARLTRLGWTCIGQPMKESDVCSQLSVARTYFTHTHQINDELNSSIRQFWEVEEYGIHSKQQLFENHDQMTLDNVRTRLKYRDGRYEVGIPWKDADDKVLPDNTPMAVSRLESTERRLLSNPELKTAYTNVIQDHIERGYVREVPTKEETEEGKRWYLPHFPVVRPDKATTKTRLVFDASAKYRGVSLNVKVDQGPKLQRDLFDVLLRFRRQPVGIICDVTEMYLQIELPPEDRPYHRFLWRDVDQSRPPKVYEFNRVVFGVNASPFLAQFVLQEHARAHQKELPLAAEAVLKSTYMDDSMDSVEDATQGIELYRQLSKMYGSAGMHARKWLSNSPEVLAEIPPTDRAAEMKLDEGELPSVKTLGILWSSQDDTFSFPLNPPPGASALTKRSILKKLATIFDPLGFISPFVIRGKMMMQELWAAGVEWDQVVEGDIEGKVRRWFEEMRALSDIRVPRCLRSDRKVEAQSLQCFSDASQSAYGAAVYIVITYNDGSITSQLIASKTRVAPLIATSIPRLELMAAILGLRLTNSIAIALEMDVADAVFWSDSMNVLWWIRRPSRSFKPFVAHRIGEIQEITDPRQWRHVPTKQNPADLLSRGMTAIDLVNTNLWGAGPDFLKTDESEWPENRVECGSKDEERKQVTFLTMETETPEKMAPTRYSSWARATRMRAWVQRFVNNCKASKSERTAGELNPGEIQQAERCVIREAQRKAFPDEYRALVNGRAIGNSSKIPSLNPNLDDDGLMRCDGRLRNAEFLSRDVRYPIILPRKDWVTKLIVKHYHELRGHVGGTNQVLADLSTKYWVIAAREEIREWERQCFGCRRLKSKAASQVMAPLPSMRVKRPLRAFARTAVDFAGPFMTKQGRGRVQLKRYLCLFTCLSSRAVHLEMAYGLDTDSFINAFNRMINRRGVPVEVISNNGTNFIGAERELRQLIEQMNKDKIMTSTSTKAIKWHFNPPLAPHFGGDHETMIKAAKQAIRKVAYKADITDEELTTVFTGAEALINSRPLTYQAADPQDETPLTPNHFLHGQAGGQFAVDAVDDDQFNPGGGGDESKRWFATSGTGGCESGCPSSTNDGNGRRPSEI